MKRCRFDAKTIIKMKVRDIKIKFIKVVILKSKLFVQNLNTEVIKIQDFKFNKKKSRFCGLQNSLSHWTVGTCINLWQPAKQATKSGEGGSPPLPLRRSS